MGLGCELVLQAEKTGQLILPGTYGVIKEPGRNKDPMSTVGRKRGTTGKKERAGRPAAGKTTVFLGCGEFLVFGNPGYAVQ